MSRWLEVNENLDNIRELLPYRGLVLSLREIVRADELCTVLGIDSWCINEGTGDGNEKISIDDRLERELAQYNLSRDVKWKFAFDVPQDTDLVLKFESLGDSYSHSIGVYRKGEFFTGDNLTILAYNRPLLYCELMIPNLNIIRK